jgi:hypothetical protein
LVARGREHFVAVLKVVVPGTMRVSSSGYRSQGDSGLTA